jgi:hypothetical protein
MNVDSLHGLLDFGVHPFVLKKIYLHSGWHS